jgi:FkbM family methyltransferase
MSSFTKGVVMVWNRLINEVLDLTGHRIVKTASVMNSGSLAQHVLRDITIRLGQDTMLHVRLNGELLHLPRDTVRTMIHCAHYTANQPFDLWVETGHLNWMMENLAPGALFVDVGAATGATLLPIASKFGGSVEIVAFEPSRTARDLLQRTLSRNRLTGVRIIPKAVSDNAGSITFVEFPQDESGEVPYLPEASTIKHGSLAPPAGSSEYTVETVTLDQELAPLTPRRTVVKIDVEGFEVQVLNGARDFIRTVRPFLSIDIHADPFGPGTTEKKVREVLNPFGYAYSNMGHVLLCSPT